MKLPRRHWVASQRGSDVACEPQLDVNVSSLPWNASGIDQTCDGNLACYALGLSGFCCPQKDGYMFGCCPVLKAGDTSPKEQ